MNETLSIFGVYLFSACVIIGTPLLLWLYAKAEQERNIETLKKRGWLLED